MNINSNVNAEEKYIRELEYLPENILNAGKLEDAEQVRRLADVEGENHKRVLANNLSQQLFDDNLRATWFQRGSSFVLNLLNSVQNVVATKASDLTNVVSNKAGDLGLQASNALQTKAELVGKQVQGAAHAASENITIKANEIGLQAAGKAQDLSASLAQKAGQVGVQAQTAALSATQSASSLAQDKALDVKNKGFEAVQTSKTFLAGKFSEYSQKLGDAVANMSLYQKFGSLIGRTNMTFAMLEEEAERAHRMNSSSEKYAIANALQMSRLIKQHFNIVDESASTEIKTLKFNTGALEEGERVRRVEETESGEKVALSNAKAVATIINDKFGNEQAMPFADVKLAQPVEAQEQKSFSAAM